MNSPGETAACFPGGGWRRFGREAEWDQTPRARREEDACPESWEKPSGDERVMAGWLPLAGRQRGQGGVRARAGCDVAPGGDKDAGPSGPTLASI